MKLSVLINGLEGHDSERMITEAEFTTMHPASSYGQPVLVLDDGNATDHLSWNMCDYCVLDATEEEFQLLVNQGFLSRMLAEFIHDLKKYDHMADAKVSPKDFDTCIYNWYTIHYPSKRQNVSSFNSDKKEWDRFIDWCAEYWDSNI
ncbi:hypothetical protein [Acinetobacter sp.]|uniref:hypothetical protein n=1 Tax=Acinetobacter sp. TaxID=472 RepID=UPI003CFDC7E6